ASREEARGKLICALEQMVAFGVTTNQAFLLACLRHPVFARGQATTAFIEQHRVLAKKDASADAALACLLLSATDSHAKSRRSGRTLAATFPVPMRVELEGHIHELEIVRAREGGYIVTDGAEHRFEIETLVGDLIRFRHDGVMESARFIRDRD